MVLIRATIDGTARDIQADETMRSATDTEIRGFVTEELGLDDVIEDFMVERTAEAILVHPKAPYG